MSILVGGGGPLLNKSFTSTDSGTTLSSGPWNITNTSGGGFTVYGDPYQNISFTVTESTNNTSLVLHDINVDLAGNAITLGSGINTVYGNIQDLSFSVSNTSVDSVGSTSTNSGTPDPYFTGVTTFATTYDVGINNVNVELGGNTISVGSGVNTIYGTMRDLTMSDTGGNAITDGAGSQLTVETLINNVTIDLTGGGVGNTITAGNGVNTVYGDMRNLTLTAGGAYANSTGLPASTNFAYNQFAASPNIQAFTDIQGLNFTVGGNTITLGSGVNTVYGDMQSLTMNALPSYAYGYNAIAASGVGDTNNSYPNFLTTQRSAPNPSYTFPPAFNNLNFNADTITVGNGVNVIYGHLQTLNISETGGSAVSPGDFPVSPGFDQSTLLNQVGLHGGVKGAVGQSNVNFTNITMGTTGSSGFMGNTITAGVGVNTIYGDIQNYVNGIQSGTGTGAFPSSPGSSVYTPLTSTFSVPFDNTSFYASFLTYDTFFMAGNTIKAGLNGSSVNTIYGSMQDFSFINVDSTGNQVLLDNAEFCNVYVLGGMGVYGSGLFPGFGEGPAFIPTLTGNTIMVGSGTNLIYGDMRDLITTDSGGVQNGLNNPLGLNGQPKTINGPSTVPEGSDPPFNTANSDGAEFFMGDNHIIAGNGVNTIYGAMRDYIDVNGGVYNNGKITSNSSTVPVIENEPSGGIDFTGLEIDAIVSIAGNTITAGSGVNTIYGSMRDLTWVEFGGNSINIAVDSFAGVFSYDTSNLISMGGNFITAGSGVNSIDGDFRNINWSVSGGVNSSSPSGSTFEIHDGGAMVKLNTMTMGDNTITAGIVGVSSVNVISGDGGNMVWSAVGGTASGDLSAWNGILLNNISMGDNAITIKGGGTSTVYGDVQSISWSAVGGNANGAHTGGGYAEGQIFGNTVTMGGNHITDLGNGTTTIYGDAQTISLSVQGGTVTNPGQGSYNNLFNGLTVITQTDAAAYMTDNTFVLGGNTIQAGSGNDTIYGSLQTLSLSAKAGSGSGTGAYFAGNIVYPDGGSTPANGSTTIVDTGNSFTFGNNTLNAGSGNDTMIGDLGSLSLTNQGGVIQNITITFGNNVFNAGSGTDIMYGNMLNSSSLAAFMVNNTVNTGTNIFNLSTGKATVYGGVGDNVLSFQNATSGVTVNLNSGTFSGNGLGKVTWTNVNGLEGSKFNDTLIGNSSNDLFVGSAGNDTITGGSGVNTIDYLNEISNLTVNLLTGIAMKADGTDHLSHITNIIGSQFGNDFLTGTNNNTTINDSSLTDITITNSSPTETFGQTTIVLGNGNDTVYGKMLDLNLNATGTAVISGSSISYAGNSITLGNGMDTVYGTLQDLTLTASGASIIGGNGGGSNEFTFGANIITLGNGNDIVYGTLQDLTLTTSGSGVIGGNGGGSNAFTFSGNTITVGDGSDTVYGTLQDLTLMASGPSIIGGEFGGSNDFTFGINTISAGSGNNDTLFGTLQNLTLDTTGDSLIGGLVAGENLLTFGTLVGSTLIGNTLGAGGGNNDTLYGTLQDASLLNGPLASPDFGIIGGLFGGDNTITFGNNSLTVGNGAGDQLFGTLHNLTLSVSSATNAANTTGGYFGGNNTFSFGNNTLTAGTGAGDQLYGTMHDLSLSAADGSSLGNFSGQDTSGGSFNLFQFGNNTLTSHSLAGGGDTLYGGMHDLVLANDGRSSPFSPSLILGNTITFGTNVLNAGSGNDVLVGELNHIDLSGVATIADFLAQNTVNPGQNTFNLGTGHDTVVLDPAIDMGVNILNSWNASNDTLQFNNATSLAAVQASVQSIASDGHSGTLVTFAPVDTNPNGGTIDFTSTAYTGQTLLTELAPHIVTVI